MSEEDRQRAVLRNGPDDLEPYRRLVELQKEMIELARQHEQTRRERDALRKQVAQGRKSGLRRRGGLQHRLRRSASRILKSIPATLRGDATSSLNDKQTSPC